MKNLFLMGLFRSGTSLLSTSLNAHKNIIIGWQPYWIFFKFCRNKFYKEIIKKPFDDDYPMGILEHESEEERTLFSDIFNMVRINDKDMDLLISQIKAYLSINEELNNNMKPYRLIDSLNNIQPGSAGHVLTQLLHRLSLSEKKTYEIEKNYIVGIKEVFCEEYILPILKKQNTVVLHIIRDPRAVVASRNYGKYMELTKSRYPIFFIIRSWRRTIMNYILNKDSKKYLMIKYEDFVSKPDKILNKICELLEVDFSNDILNFDNFRDIMGNKWESNSSFESCAKFNTNSINKWQKILSSEEIEVIEYFCQREIKYLGYNLTTTHFNTDRIYNFKDNTSDIRDWLKKYNFTIKD